jgi:hypothetical protein
MLAAVAIIAILIGLLLPAVQGLGEAARAAEQFPKLKDVASQVLEIDEALTANLDGAKGVLDAALIDHRLPSMEVVAAHHEVLSENEMALEAARKALPKLGRGDDADYRMAYLKLRKALDDASDGLRKIDDRLAELLEMIEQSPPQ